MLKPNDHVSVCCNVKDENGCTVRKETTGKIIRVYSVNQNCFVVNFSGKIVHCAKGILRKI